MIAGADASVVPVLMYHEVRKPQNSWEQRYFVAPSRFEEHVQALVCAGYRPCSLAAFCAWTHDCQSLPPNAIVITFDDGYRGVFQYAYPVLTSKRIPFAVFLVSAAIGKTDAWLRGVNPANTAYPLMSRGEVLELLRAGVEFGAHSRHHADLPTLKVDGIDDEVRGSRIELEALLGVKVDCFAYPYGRVSERVRVAVADAGYTCAFSTRSGFNQRGVDPFMLRRIDVYGTDTPAALLRKLRFGTNNGSVVTALRYYASRARRRLGKELA